MKIGNAVVVGLTALLPLYSVASITVYAPAQDGAYAYVYNPNTGATYDTVQFSGGIANLNTDTMGYTTPWAVDITYSSAKIWQSRVFHKTPAGTYSAYNATWGGGNMSVTSVVGAVTSRSYKFSDTAKRQISVTYQGAVGQAVSLSTMNNDTLQLDAQLKLYRPTSDISSEIAGAATKVWDPTTLTLGSYDVIGQSSYDSTIDIIQVSGADFLANYLGKWNTDKNAYDLYFTAHDDPGNTAYWSTYNNDGGSENGVFDNGDGSFTFTATATGAFNELDETKPYYVFMDRAQSFDGSADKSGLSLGYDMGVDILNPTIAAIPEPAVISFILGGGGFLLIIRRFFMKG
jgi:hypothetical protein